MKIPDLSVESLIEQNGGDFTDFFEKLKTNEALADLFDRHPIDDPAAWPELGRRFILNLAEVQESLNEAESMIATQDRVGGLSGKVQSAEKTRAKGRELKETAAAQIDLLKRSLTLMDQLRAVLDTAVENYALTTQILIRNTSGQGFEGKILFIDGEDVIVSRQGGSFYRIPIDLLDTKTQKVIAAALQGSWETLQGVSTGDLEPTGSNNGELVAYSDDLIYVKDATEGLVAEARGKTQFVFSPYEEQIEARGRRLSNDKKAELQQKIDLNALRLKQIERLESKFGVAIPLVERESSPIEVMDVEEDPADRNEGEPATMTSESSEPSELTESEL